MTHLQIPIRRETNNLQSTTRLDYLAYSPTDESIPIHLIVQGPITVMDNHSEKFYIE